MLHFKIRNSTRTRILKAIINDGLIESNASREALTKKISGNGSIYFGTGLASTSQISTGTPFDLLGMILVAEKLRQAAGLGAIYQHIADTHAKSNYWINSEEVDTKAQELKQKILTITHNLDLKDYYVSLSSEFDNCPEYIKLINYFKAHTTLNEYFVREMADIEWYRKKHNVVIKLGWTIQRKNSDIIFDERKFDQEYTRIMGHKISFVYTKPGRTLDKSRPKAPPYIQIKGENRILLNSDEPVQEKILDAISRTHDPYLGGALKHLEYIVRDYEMLFGSLGNASLENKVQFILKKILL